MECLSIGDELIHVVLEMMNIFLHVPVHDRGMLYPQGLRVWISTGKGTSPGSYLWHTHVGMCLRASNNVFHPKKVIFLIVFKEGLFCCTPGVHQISHAPLPNIVIMYVVIVD